MSIEIGKNIIKKLKEKNMTQKELAKMVGATEAQMSRYLTGDREPKPDMLANIATALHTTSDFLLGIENTQFDFFGIKRIIARNAENMSDEEKKELLMVLFDEEI